MIRRVLVFLRQMAPLPPPGVAVLSLLVGSCSTGTEPLYTFWEGDLSPVPPANVTGTVVAVTQFGRTEASVEIRLGQPESLYGWRIDSGTCEQDGLLQGGIASYPLMETDEAGAATEDALLSNKFRPGNRYAARIYRPLEGGEQEVVACGDLTEVDDGGGAP